MGYPGRTVSGGPVVTVVGGRELRRDLKRAGGDLKQLREPNLAAAQVVSSSARTGAPRRSGALAASTRPGATQRAAIVRAGGARVPYAGVIHYGWPRRSIRPQPYILSAASRTEPQWLREYVDHLNAVLARITGL